MNIFMRAAKKKLRFDTDRGVLSAECLWDLPLEVLNTLTINLKVKVGELEETGYLEVLIRRKGETNDNLRFQVAEATIVARVEEVQAQEKAAENKLQRENLLVIIASKEAQALEGQGLEKLKAMAESLR